MPFKLLRCAAAWWSDRGHFSVSVRFSLGSSFARRTKEFSASCELQNHFISFLRCRRSEGTVIYILCLIPLLSSLCCPTRVRIPIPPPINRQAIVVLHHRNPAANQLQRGYTHSLAHTHRHTKSVPPTICSRRSVNRRTSPWVRECRSWAPRSASSRRPISATKDDSLPLIQPSVQSR